ncbi:MAG TPA: LLM class flavin-dependent oxidoreductase [Stellaceae bacterium]|jgi:alkanesulfonate monooxygenase SsuD/methylene tetrahydromethanopterin reductase-like flavin-dependent oxidoreductase (luciferase family)|nr:LLM class flavin-dependent oxidoreductase [Stellaceae bacterium]
MADDSRAQTNPLFGANRLKLGVFALNAEINVMTTVPEKFTPTWANGVEVAQMADRAGYEALVPYARWGSWGPDAHHYTARAFENLTWAAGIAAKTNRACVMSTVQVMTVHPLLAAKAMTTIDHVSNGRFALNIVVGNAMENAMFGAPSISHDDYYDYAEEWISIVKRLWSDSAMFDYSGKYITVTGAMSQPKPIQKPFPALMNAARSAKGQNFVANHCDIAFVRGSDSVSLDSQIAGYRRQALETSGRDIQMWCNCFVVQRESKVAAEKYLDRVVEEYGDDGYLDTFIRIQNPTVDRLPPAQREAMRKNLKRVVGGEQLLGSADDIARAIVALSGKGIDGILLNWVDPRDGVARFNDAVMPLLIEAGLRGRPAPE